MKTINKAFMLWSVIAIWSSLVATSTFAAYDNWFNRTSQTRWKSYNSWYNSWNSGVFGQYTKNITQSTANVSNWIQVTYSTSDAATLTYLQAFNFQNAFSGLWIGITVSQTNITNWIQVTVISTDSTTITKLQGLGNITPNNLVQWVTNTTYSQYEKNITKTPVNISNWVQITYTTTDPATFTFLQGWFQFSTLFTQYWNSVTVSQANVSNWVQVTVTSTDAVTITKLQGLENRNYGNNYDNTQWNINNIYSQFAQYSKNVSQSTANISNWVQVTYSTSDSATLTYLQWLNFQTIFSTYWIGISVAQTNISNWVQVTITSTDAATITKLQNLGNIGSNIFQWNTNNNLYSQYIQYEKNVSKSSVNISNWVQVTFTTIDSATLTFLQGWFQFSTLFTQYWTLVSISQANISNWVQVTITSTDAATITKLQNLWNTSSNNFVQPQNNSFHENTVRATPINYQFTKPEIKKPEIIKKAEIKKPEVKKVIVKKAVKKVVKKQIKKNKK